MCALYRVISTILLINLLATTNAHFNESNNPLECVYEQRKELADDCRILKVFNQNDLERAPFNETHELARYCACQLNALPWEQAFDDHPATRLLEAMVEGVLKKDKYKHEYPAYLWSDIDVVVRGVSIYTSTKDYFDKRRLNASVAILSQDEMERDSVFRTVRYVCIKVARDRYKLYQYLENLARISPMVFFRLIEMNDVINLIYQASKACKLLIVHRVNDFKLRPDNRELIAIDKLSLKDESDLANMISHQANDIDLALKDASVLLTECKPWQRVKKSLDELGQDCPMMMADELPVEWTLKHASPTERSRIAIKCGCQLLLHNSTWGVLMQDSNIQMMSKTLTNYINLNRFPQFNEIPSWAIYGWFTNMMDKFAKDRKLSVNELIKFYRGDQDPTSIINRQTKDEMYALEILRRGCNLLVLNHNNKAPEQVSEIKLIKYLDNLRFISQDPMFVFHLTLQDPNLFKLHALSKMCEPILK